MCIKFHIRGPHPPRPLGKKNWIKGSKREKREEREEKRNGKDNATGKVNRVILSKREIESIKTFVKLFQIEPGKYFKICATLYII